LLSFFIVITWTLFSYLFPEVPFLRMRFNHQMRSGCHSSTHPIVPAGLCIFSLIPAKQLVGQRRERAERASPPTTGNPGPNASSEVILICIAHPKHFAACLKAGRCGDREKSWWQFWK
jgi:hypothetical protein